MCNPALKKKTAIFATVAAVGLLLISITAAQATLIDFEGLSFTTITVGGDITPNPASVITSGFGSVGVLFGQPGVSTGVAVVRDSLAPSSGLNSVAGLNAAGIIPGSPAGGADVGDIFFNFVVPGTSTPAATDLVSFTIGDNGFDLDVFQIRSFNLANTLINTQNVSGISRFPVTISVAGIHRVEVDFTGDFGYSLDDLNFNSPAGGPAVPEPSSLLLLGSGIGGVIGFVLWRARTKKNSCDHLLLN